MIQAARGRLREKRDDLRFHTEQLQRCSTIREVIQERLSAV